MVMMGSMRELGDGKYQVGEEKGGRLTIKKEYEMVGNEEDCDVIKSCVYEGMESKEKVCYQRDDDLHRCQGDVVHEIQKHLQLLGIGTEHIDNLPT